MNYTYIENVIRKHMSIDTPSTPQTVVIAKKSIFDRHYVMYAHICHTLCHVCI